MHGHHNSRIARLVVPSKALAMVHTFDLKGSKFMLLGFRRTTPRLSNHKLVGWVEPAKPIISIKCN
jgi:hypothetical protein